MKTSERLTIGQVYTREQLKAMFDVTDATINTGIFKPVWHDSVWLSVTEQKTPDQTQYEDKLRGDILEWDGQQASRKDPVIIEHRKRGLELVLFYH